MVLWNYVRHRDFAVALSAIRDWRHDVLLLVVIRDHRVSMLACVERGDLEVAESSVEDMRAFVDGMES